MEMNSACARDRKEARVAGVQCRKRGAEGDGSRLGPDRGAALGTTGCMIYEAWCKIKMQDPFIRNY